MPTLAQKTAAKVLSRCHWADDDALMQRYHDEEWGVPLRDDQKLFEFLILDGAQAGLSWRTILHRREGYRKAFYKFNAKRMAEMTVRDVERLMKDKGIIRNRLKIESAIRNAKAYLALQKELGSFSQYLWGFVTPPSGSKRLDHYGKLPVTTTASDAMSKDLKKRGFNFVGSTICYAFMQAAGMVDDHLDGCFRAVKRKSRL